MNRLLPILIVSSNILTGSLAAGQTEDEILAFLKQRFERYCNENPREEIFLSSDREEYISGEDLWFALFLIDRKSLIPYSADRIAYVELLNSENRPLVQKRIVLTDGFAPGHMVIPGGAPTGCYSIRAYTSWMKNFLPENCFTKSIRIYDPFPPGNVGEKLPVLTYSGAGNRVVLGQKDNVLAVKLEIDRDVRRNVTIRVMADEKFRADNNRFYIFIQTHGNIDFCGSEKLAEDTVSLSLPVALRPGINQVTLFNSRGQPETEKYIFTPDEKSINYGIKSTAVAHNRERIRLSVEPADSHQIKINNATFSVSVAPAVGGQFCPDIRNYLLFGSEFGFSPLNKIGNRNMSQIPEKEVNDILSGLKSNWIIWSDILSGNRRKYEFDLESDWFFLRGKLFTGDKMDDVVGRMIFLCIPGKKSVFRYASTDQEGNFSFPLNPDEDTKDIIIVPEKVTQNERIIIGSSFSDRFAPVRVSDSTVYTARPAWIEKLSFNYQVMKVFRTSQTGRNLKPAILPIRKFNFYGKPDFEMKMADYIKLPVMEEVIFELLPMVSLRKRSGNYEIFINDWVNDFLQTSRPLLMIDGVVIKDAALIVGLDPEFVERIDVVKNKYLIGKYILPSIVNVITIPGDFSQVPLPDYMIRFPFRVADPVPSFVSPDYSSEVQKNSRIPDYRNTLFWSPPLRTASDGKASFEFFTSDNKSDYLITVQGISSTGKPIYIQRTLSVK